MMSDQDPSPVITTELDGTRALAGFRFGGVRCGIKHAGCDLGLVVCNESCSVVGCFTQNEIRAPSVSRSAALLPSTTVRAVVVNSGNANVLTGAEGVAANEAMAVAVARELGLEPDQVLTASTGPMGVLLPLDLVEHGARPLSLSRGDDPMSFASAILTTDTAPKVAHLQVQLPGDVDPITIVGVAKGAGMVHPNMATTLGFVFTDAQVSPPLLQALLREHIEDSFNAISVDGDTSTNDMVLAFASGLSNADIEAPGRRQAFSSAFRDVLLELAKQVASDGEGSSRRLEIEVRGAPSKQSARAIARGVCRSTLVKCSAFGGQPEFGRVAMAVGQAAAATGVGVDVSALSIASAGQVLYDADGPRFANRSAVETDRQGRPMVQWSVDLGLGSESAKAYGCDLTYDYVRMNAEEERQVDVSRSGGTGRAPSLGAYSPGLKHQLLCEGLSYVRRFTGLRTLVFLQHPTAAPDGPSNLARDLELCLDAGLRPLAVVPDRDTADAVMEHIKSTGHYPSQVSSDPASISRDLDRGKLCVLVRETPAPDELVELALRLGISKFIALGEAQGLRDAHGYVQRLSPDAFLTGHERGRFDRSDADLLMLAKHAATRGVPALHIIDARVPHAMVGELFTDEGVGTLITRQG